MEDATFMEALYPGTRNFESFRALFGHLKDDYYIDYIYS